MEKLKRHKLCACVLAGIMVLSMAACGKEEAPAKEQTPVAEEEFSFDSEVSIDFKDGLYGFVGSDKSVNPAAKEAGFAIGKVGERDALLVSAPESGNIYAKIQMDALLGDNISRVKSVEFTLESIPDKTFKAVGGKIHAFLGENNEDETTDWSIYLEKKNPKKIVVEFKKEACAGNYLVLTEGDTSGSALSTLAIEAISFKDSAGNLMSVDTNALVSAEEAGPDRSNLATLENAVEFPGFACSGDAWAQNGFEMPEEIVNALEPGSVVEIEYKSEDGTMWLVMPWAEAGWMRVADNGGAYINDSKSIAQVTYEQIEALCGEDKATWGAMMQCEASSAWEVYSVKVGKKSSAGAFTPAVEFADFACSGDAWAQNGFEMSAEIVDALVPGSVVKITYKSDDNTMWLVMPWAEAGWMRVGQAGTDDPAVCDGSVCYVTYEQIEALCGEDKATWGAMMQCEASSAWEVYSVEIGSFSEGAPALKGLVEFPGFACSADAWAQNGYEMPEEILNALVPGSVVKISYKSDDNTMWLVMPWATAGWMRVGQAGTEDPAICDGSVCYVTYEQIEALCGEDKSTWGAMMQCEASSAWEVYSVSIGQK